MATRKVSVTRYIEQVTEGTHYRGYIKVDDTKFDFEIVFIVPIPQIDELEIDKLEPAADLDEYRRKFQITIKRNDASIDLTHDEYTFFHRIIFRGVIMFYFTGQARIGGNSVSLLEIASELVRTDVSIVICTIGIISFEFPQGLCEMLSSPKFGCRLVSI